MLLLAATLALLLQPPLGRVSQASPSLATPIPAAHPAGGLSWLGMTLGEPASALRAAFGDPLLVRPSGLSRVASYLRDDDATAAVNVTERDGVVFAIEYVRERRAPGAALRARDPFGVAVGMAQNDVLVKRGRPAIETTNSSYYPVDAQSSATVIYRFEDGVVDSIKLVGSPATAAGNERLAHVAEARGDAYATAILDVSTTVAASQHFRERYLAVHDCAAAGRTMTTERRENRTYAVVTATCAERKRTMYFDITHASPQ